MKKIIALVALSVAAAVAFALRPRAGTAAVANQTDRPASVYVSFGADSAITSWSFCTPTSRLNCKFALGPRETRDLPLAGKHLNATIAFGAPPSCGQTVLEANVNTANKTDTANVSLVNGFGGARVAITVRDARGTHVLGPVTSATGNEKAFGVYPLGCDICVARQRPPCGIAPGKDGCKTGPDQYHPDVPCQYQSGSGGAVTFSLLP